MQFENTLADLLKLFTNAESGVFLLFSAIITVLVQVIKNNCLNKLQIDLKNKFDPTVLLPFCFGLLFAVINFFVIKKEMVEGIDSLGQIFIDGLSLGATAMMIYRVFSSFDKTNLKTLCKDGVFSILYNELLIVTDVRKQLIENEISFLEFLEKLQEAEWGVKAIYDNSLKKEDGKAEENDAREENNLHTNDQTTTSTVNEQEKLQCLKVVLSGLVSQNDLDKVAETLHKAFEDYFAIL